MTGPLTGIDVLILAGGKGTRIKDSLPAGVIKCLADINGQSVLQRQANRLWAAGADRIIVSLPNNFAATIYARCIPGLECVYEPRPLGTVAAVRYARHLLYSNPVVIMNGDTWCDFDFVDLMRHAPGYNLVYLTSPSGLNGGHYRMNQRLLGQLCKARETQIEEFIPHILRRMNVAIPDFIDIGTPEGLERARREIR